MVTVPARSTGDPCPRSGDPGGIRRRDRAAPVGPSFGLLARPVERVRLLRGGDRPGANNRFAAAYPDWFGSIGSSLYTLFQIMTLESWSRGIARPVMEQFPHAWLFFVVFILVATFTMLNLFIAIIVNAMQCVHEDEHDSGPHPVEHMQKHLDVELHLLRNEIRPLREDVMARNADSTSVTTTPRE